MSSALARPQQRWNDDQAADLADFAAVYLVGFAQSLGLTDGNTRTGLACTLVFLVRNRKVLHVDGAALYALTMRVATNQAGNSDVAVNLRERSS